MARNTDKAPIGEFLWDHLDRAAIEKAWSTYNADCGEGESLPTPLEAFDFLKNTAAKLWVSRTNCIHGDLNATNVAIDASREDNPQAYIFDAAGMRADIQFRNLAALEVTTILFNSVGIDDRLIDTCKVAYQDTFLPDPVADPSRAHHFAQNVLTMITAIRSHFQSEQQKTAYALLVFDAVVRQLFGLGVQPSPNKVKNPIHACILAKWVTRWLSNMVPEVFTALTVSETRAVPE